MIASALPASTAHPSILGLRHNFLDPKVVLRHQVRLRARQGPRSRQRVQSHSPPRVLRRMWDWAVGIRGALLIFICRALFEIARMCYLPFAGRHGPGRLIFETNTGRGGGQMRETSSISSTERQTARKIYRPTESSSASRGLAGCQRFRAFSTSRRLKSEDTHVSQQP